MSMFSSIDAEHHRSIVKQAVEIAKKKVENTFISDITRNEMNKILEELLKECESEIQE